MKHLPEYDFRSRRWILEPEDFALGSDEPDGPPNDLIDAKTWESIVSLQDDVSIRTSNDYGSTLALLWRYKNEWNCLVIALQELEASPEKSSAMLRAMLPTNSSLRFAMRFQGFIG